MQSILQEYFSSLKGKRVAVIGIGVSNTPLKGIIKEVILPMIVMLIVLAIVTYIPDVVLFLPRVFMGYGG